MTLQPNLLGAKPIARRIRVLQGSIGVVAAILAALVWQLLQGGEAGPRTAAISDVIGSTASTSASSAPSAVRVPKPVTTGAIVSLAVGVRGDSFRYYESGTGRAFGYVPASGRTETLSDALLKGFVRSYWVPKADRVISVFDEKGAERYRASDFATAETTQIGTAVTALAVAADGRKVVYAETEERSTGLFIADTAGVSPERLLATRAESIRLSWPAGGDAVVMVSRRPGNSGDDLSFISPEGLLTQVLSNREDLEISWSPDGGTLLYSYFVPDEGIGLFLRDRASSREYPLGVPTSARKCAWHPTDTSVICGVPTKTALARGVPADGMATTDDIVRIDTVTGEQTTLFRVAGGSLLGVIDPALSPSGNFFAFPNLFDKRLYVLDLR